MSSLRGTSKKRCIVFFSQPLFVSLSEKVFQISYVSVQTNDDYSYDLHGLQYKVNKLLG